LGVTTKSLYAWVKRYGEPTSDSKELMPYKPNLGSSSTIETSTEERDILKEAAVDSTDQRHNYDKTLVIGDLLYETYN
jgi:transposase